MHGDDVASSGTGIATQVVSKAVEIFIELLKLKIEQERQRKMEMPDDDTPDLSGGEVTYQRLKEGIASGRGGEISTITSFSKEDYKELVSRAEEIDIPIAAMQENGKDNTLSVYFLKSDTEAVNAIVQDIVRQKLNQPEQTERMITIDKEQAEGFQMLCSDHDIPVTFLETSNGVKCIYNNAYEKSIDTAMQKFQDMRSELKNTSVDVRIENGKPKLTVMDST